MPAVKIEVTGPMAVPVGIAGVQLTFKYPFRKDGGVSLLGLATNGGVTTHACKDHTLTPGEGIQVPIANTDRTNQTLVAAGTIDKGKVGLYLASTVDGNKVEVNPFFE